MLIGPAEWVDKEHQEETRVDANVIVPHRADGVDVGAVVGADVHVGGREDLQVPVRG